jgi:hypothetical protein
VGDQDDHNRADAHDHHTQGDQSGSELDCEPARADQTADPYGPAESRSHAAVNRVPLQREETSRLSESGTNNTPFSEGGFWVVPRGRRDGKRQEQGKGAAPTSWATANDPARIRGLVFGRSGYWGRG